MVVAQADSLMTGASSARRTVAALGLLAAVAVVLTVVLACTDQTLLLVNDGLSTVRYGVPFDWLIQESWLTPPQHLLPYELSPMDPREFPLTVALGPFAVDVLIVYAVLLSVALIARVRQMGVSLALLLPVALIVMVVITSSERQLVTTKEGLADVGFGSPLDWAIQDHQIQATPPPYVLSPQWLSIDVSLAIDWLAFAMDLLLTYALLLAALLAMRLVRRRGSQTPPA